MEKNGRTRLLDAIARSPLLGDGAMGTQLMHAGLLQGNCGELWNLTEPEKVLREAYRVIAPEGSLILTWPSAMVDPILRVLHTLHLVSDEMESEEHQKRIPVETLQQMLHRIGFQKFIHRHFELGLNNLMVAFR